ncbi:hypothetical protein [Myxacorys almedinensis]|uniref:Uncharacterized protein n=1 Tax=Myxacorys almedinensis A TaxID=2690445 RepID=A0A8J8CNB3_9CYAN|nr:hypothetical protein [Myxacorys almedinensis]NDJ18242.1 hypothetical protein [Myxacorys almedinensis A]
MAEIGLGAIALSGISEQSLYLLYAMRHAMRQPVAITALVFPAVWERVLILERHY